MAIIFALGMPIVAAGAAFSVETSYDYYKHQKLQAAADAAAYAGALEVINGSDSATIIDAATKSATSNGWLAASGTITVHNPPTSGPNQVNQAVEVILTQNEPRFFTAVFTNQQVVLKRRAVAEYQTAADACVVALNKTASRAINVTGSASMNLAGCDVASNSNASDSLYTWGSSNVHADCALAVGQIANNGAMTLSFCPGGLNGVQTVDDPFANVPTPTVPGPCISQQSYNGASLQPGYYCNGITLKGSDTLAPGLYYVAGNNFTISANAQVSGSGVTIYTAGTSRVNMTANSDVQLSAPTTGDYSGILFMGDRSNTGGTSNIFTGDTASRLTGNLYFATQAVSYLGNFTGINGCTYVVADTVTWSGSATFSVDCTNQGMKKIPARNLVKLVE
ncbi:MAG: pilus assembly protein TadG-related protein [Rhodospirillaceae bacterium]